MSASRWSISTWLTGYYTAFVLALLGGVAGLLYWDLQHSMLQQDEAFLQHKMQVLSVLLQQRPLDRSGIDQEALEEAEISSGSPTPFALRVLDERNRLIVETSHMAAVLPVRDFPARAGAAVRVHRRSSAGDAEWLLASSAVLQTLSPSAGWHVQAALNITSQERLLAGYRRDIAGLLVAGLIVSALVGAWLTHRGLKPVAQITHAVERIGAQQLQERIQKGPWPRELTALASAFDAMLDRLQEAFERLSQFSADLAHELRTPITNLMGETQVALSRPRTTAEYRTVLHSGLEEYGRLARMIDNMLFLAQADRAHSALALTTLDAALELHAVADFYQALADEQGVVLVCQGSATVLADPLLLRRALSNLLSNALKYTPAGGQITLQAQESAAGESILSVSDTGIGIASRHLSKLGDRFYRIDPARADGAAGAGLGLAIAKSIMALHGGRLQINSTPGQGTSAHLVFPTTAALLKKSA